MKLYLLVIKNAPHSIHSTLDSVHEEAARCGSVSYLHMELPFVDAPSFLVSSLKIVGEMFAYALIHLRALLASGFECEKGALQDTHCFYCKEWLEHGGTHASNCQYLAAEAVNKTTEPNYAASFIPGSSSSATPGSPPSVPGK
jgi:hypothetical protein